MRRLASILTVLAIALTFGCGAQFELPTETPGGAPIPSDGSYAMLATWDGLPGIQDILLWQSQLFLCFNEGGSGPPSVPRGNVQQFTLTRPEPVSTAWFTPPKGLFNPVALAATNDRLLVLDQGDSCLARYNPAFNSCEAASNHNNPIRDFSAWWRVREYPIGGNDTISTFTDTTFAMVYGVAADAAGYVYVSGVAVVLDTSATNPNIRTRKFVSRIYRYARGPRYPGIVPPDRYMPGSNWHRDTTWFVFDGTGTSSVSDPRGIEWTTAGLPALFIADRGNNKAKLVSTQIPGSGFLGIDGSETGSNLDHPMDISVDLAGYLYVVDGPNRRVLRYTPNGQFVQILNTEPNAQGLDLLDPVSVGVDDSMAYIGDRGRGQVIRYKRRP
jgi:hypothetical protein